MSEYAGVYLEISLLDWPQRNPKTFPKFQQNSRTFQDFPGLLGTMNNDNLELLNELCVDDSMSMEEIESYFKD